MHPLFSSTPQFFPSVFGAASAVRPAVRRLLPPPSTHNREPYDTLLSDTIATDPSVEPMPADPCVEPMPLVLSELGPRSASPGTRQADSARAGSERPIGPCAGVIARAVSVLAGPPQDRAKHAELELLQVGLD